MEARVAASAGPSTGQIGVPKIQRYPMRISPRFCVYAHRHDTTIFYIGQGRLERPFQQSNRNARWHHYVKRIGWYTIEILGYFDTQTAAINEEVRLLKALQPLCNIDLGYTCLIPDAIPPAMNVAPLRPKSLEAQLVQLAQRVVCLENQCRSLAAALDAARQHRCPFFSPWCIGEVLTNLKDRLASALK
jgi:hypothetical protein